jgi:predicted negative regulator of RcsB-dependent stress response
MAKHLDLEEQEQLDEIKHFWKQYGNLITWALLIICGSFAAWNGYNYWQRGQQSQAAMMYDEVERAAASGDVAQLDRAVTDMKDKFGSTAFAQQAGLLAAKTYYDKGNLEGAKASLSWVAGKSADPGYQALAKLRLAAVLLEAKAYDEALQQLTGTFHPDFTALVADRRGDILMAQGKPSEARSAYEAAYKGMDAQTEYRRLVEVKLNALGVNPSVASPSPAAAAAASSTTATEAKQ